MKWNYIDFSGNGISGEIIERFESDNKIKTKITMKDKSGNILLNINSKKEKIEKTSKKKNKKDYKSKIKEKL